MPDTSPDAPSVNEIERLRDDLQGANECLDMIRERIEVMGHPMDKTPPYSYNDAISNLMFDRLKEAGAFPGHPATVTYERVGDPEHERYLKVPVESQTEA